MLTVNLLPWRDDAKARQKKFFKRMTLLTLITSFVICILIYHHYKNKLHDIDEHIVRLTKKSEKYANTPNNSLVDLQKIINKTQCHQDELKKLLHVMFVYSTITWDSIEIQKGMIKVYGVANLMTLLLSFIEYCEKRFNVTVIIKSIKILSPFDAVKFQVQVDRGCGVEK